MATIIKRDFPRKGNSISQDKKGDIPLPIYILRCTLAFSDPPIWRVFKVPSSLYLSELAALIKICMEWNDNHGSQFLVGKKFYANSERPTEEKIDSDIQRQKNVQLVDLEESMKFIFTYIYDAGGGWECEIDLEESIPNPKDGIIPCIIDGQNAAPPETVNDIHEYNEMVRAYFLQKGLGNGKINTSPFPDQFDPAHFDAQSMNDRIDRYFQG